ncbi:hypothetical protein AB3N58_10560 [Leptospira sp. WS60.C2]
MKRIILTFSLFCIATTCKIDLRQLPFPNKPTEPKSNYLNSIYLRNFTIKDLDLNDMEGPWKYTVNEFLKSHESIARSYKILEKETLTEKQIYIDMDLTYKFDDEFYFWYSLPIIYPIPLIWPIHIRESTYHVQLDYRIFQDGIVLVQDHVRSEETLTLYFYGYIRPVAIESMVYDKNLEVIEKCVKNISSKLSSL